MEWPRTRDGPCGCGFSIGGEKDALAPVQSSSKQFKAALFVYGSAVIACHCHVHCHCIALSWLTKLPGLHTICWAPRWATCKQAKLIKFPEWKCHYESMSTNVMAKTQIAAQTSKQTTLTWWFADVFRCVSMCLDVFPCWLFELKAQSPHCICCISVAYLLHLYLSESLCLWWARSVPGAWIASLANFTALAIDKMGSKSVSSYFKYL